MSPIPPGRSRWLAPAALLMLTLGAITWWSSSPRAPAPLPPPPAPAMLPPLRAGGSAPPARRPTVVPAALARAVAAVGAFDDGRRARLDDLAEDLQALIEPARALLGTTPRQAAPGLPMLLPDGTEVRIGPDPMRVAAGSEAPITPGSPADRERARAVDGRLVARSLHGGGKAPVPTRGDLVKEILEPDAWIAVPYDPALAAGEPFALTNRSLGEYVLRLEAADYGSVRLNGGLVVPGRYYLLDGTMTVTSDVPVGVVIRPLGVVHGYYDRPLRPPAANG